MRRRWAAVLLAMCACGDNDVPAGDARVPTCDEQHADLDAFVAANQACETVADCAIAGFIRRDCHTGTDFVVAVHEDAEAHAQRLVSPTPAWTRACQPGIARGRRGAVLSVRGGRPRRKIASNGPRGAGTRAAVELAMPRTPTAPLVPSVVSPRARRLPHAAVLVTALLCAGAAAVVSLSVLGPRAVGHEHHRRAHAAAPAQPTPSAPAAAAAPTLERHIDRAELDALLSAQESPGARIVPAMRSGRPVGFKLYAIQPGSLPAALGLENGDTLHRVNGRELSSPERALTAYHELRAADRFELELTRAGEPLLLRVAVD